MCFENDEVAGAMTLFSSIVVKRTILLLVNVSPALGRNPLLVSTPT